MKDKHLTKLRSRARQLYREHEAIQILLNHVTVDGRKSVEATKKALSNFKESELRRFIEQVRKRNDRDRDFYGIKAPDSVLIGLLSRIESNPPDRPFALIPKYLIREMFDHYEKANPNFDKYPEHLRIEIDPGIARQHQGSVELVLLEATLFEDMCALFNLTKQTNTDLDRWSASKKTAKMADALRRASIAAAFYFVESYLNGIAFDYYTRNKDQLDLPTIEILTEAKRYLSISEKADKYSRIIIGQTHAPLNKDNCPELSFMVKKAKLLRDAIVHASPKVDIDSFDPSREQLLAGITFAEVESVVDNGIRLVKKIDEAISGRGDRLFWLTERDQSGFFPDAAFS